MYSNSLVYLIVCLFSTSTDGEGKIDTQSNLIPSAQANTSEKVMGVTVGTARVAGKAVGTVLSPSVTSSLELKDSPTANAKTSPASVQPPSSGTPNESWLHVCSSYSC